MKIIDKFEELVIVVGMIAMVIFNFLNVVCRFLLPQTPFSYTEELVVLIFVWITMFGIACAYKKMAHTGLTILTDHFHGSAKIVFAVLSMICSVCFMLLVIWYGIDMVQNQIAHGQILPGMKIPAATQSLAIPVGGVLILIRAIQACLIEIKTIRKGAVEK